MFWIIINKNVFLLCFILYENTEHFQKFTCFKKLFFYVYNCKDCFWENYSYINKKKVKRKSLINAFINKKKIENLE